MTPRWKRIARRVFALMLACAACSAALAGLALASESGETWLNWVYEHAGVGVHDKWYYHFEQAASEVNDYGNVACANGWLGSTGHWVFPQDACGQWGEQTFTPALGDPGRGAYPWAQSQKNSAYLWAWAGYCGSC
jgi:hypothetical protein